MPEEDWPMTPAGIESWLRWYDSLEPTIVEAHAEIEAFLKARKEEQKALFDMWTKELERTWDE